MSAVTLIKCSADGCRATYEHDTHAIIEARRVAKYRLGWTFEHRGNRVFDLCPKHKTKPKKVR